jgi:hypothetical protein|tara:strand:+ start:9456 stop:9818 length:363 start_codon:yes stop_codon:yes gene_type:complete
MLKLVKRLNERLYNHWHNYSPALKEDEQLTDEECDGLQAIVEARGWDALIKVKDNVNKMRNRNAISMCDGRSLVEFKKMEALDDLFVVVDHLVDAHRERTKPVEDEDKETPRKMHDYVPR